MFGANVVWCKPLKQSLFVCANVNIYLNQHNRKCLSFNLLLIFPFVWVLNNFMVQSLWPQTPALSKHPLGMTLTLLVGLSTCHSHETNLLRWFYSPSVKQFKMRFSCFISLHKSKEWCLLFGMCIVLKLIFYLSYSDVSCYNIFIWVMKISAYFPYVNSVAVHNFSFLFHFYLNDIFRKTLIEYWIL